MSCHYDVVRFRATARRLQASLIETHRRDGKVSVGMPGWNASEYAAIPKPQPLASAEFRTVRLRLIKVAARIIETATRVRIAFAASCPEAELFGGIARWLQPAGP